jgi:hypothetical protein
MKKQVTVREFVADLIQRIDQDKGIDCCREEIKTFARMAEERMGDELIEVEWKDPPAS